MKIIPVYNCKIFPKQFSATTLYPFIFIRKSKKEVSYSTLKHEMIHVEQIREYGWLTFYVSYLLYFTANLIKIKKWMKAYKYILWEITAYNGMYMPLTQAEADELGVD